MSTDRVTGFDHVSLPMVDTEGMIAFYRALGFDITERPAAVSVHVGDQMINFHRPATWQRESFTLRAERAAAVRRPLLRLERHAGSTGDGNLLEFMIYP